MIPRDVQHPCAVDRQGNGVVRIADVPAIRRRPDLPVCRSNLAPGQHDPATLVVVGRVLAAIARRDGVPAEDDGVDGVAGPAWADRHEACAARGVECWLRGVGPRMGRQSDGEPT